MKRERSSYSFFCGGETILMPRSPHSEQVPLNTNLCGYRRCTRILWLFREIETIQCRCVTLHLIQENLKFRFYIYFENVVFFICFYSDLRQNLKTFSYLFKKRFGLHLIFPNQVSAFYYDVIQFINQNMKNKSSSAKTIRGKNYVGFL